MAVLHQFVRDITHVQYPCGPAPEKSVIVPLNRQPTGHFWVLLFLDPYLIQDLRKFSTRREIFLFLTP